MKKFLLFGFIVLFLIGCTLKSDPESKKEELWNDVESINSDMDEIENEIDMELKVLESQIELLDKENEKK